MKRDHTKQSKRTTDSNNGSIRDKKIKVEFNEIEFKFLLKNPDTAFSGFEKFIETANQFPDNTNYDLVASFCQSTKDAHEILLVLEAGQRKPSELSSIFEALECILIRTADDLKKFSSVALSIVHNVLTHHMGALMTCLRQSNKSSHIKAALKLLSSMVAQGEKCASDVQKQFDFKNPNIPGLLKRRDIKDPQDVRTCLLQFIMSFLVYGDNLVIRTLVEQKGFLNGIFAGMCYDRVDILQVILETLSEKVVQNPTVSKTLKIRLFNETTIKSLIQLYSWKGPKKWQELKKSTIKEVETSNQEDLTTVQSLAHNFLLEVCCSHKFGITFTDKSYGTSSKNMNHVLTSILQALPVPTECHLVADLATQILRACPDQLGRYLTQKQHSFNPRHSDPWFKFMDFLTQIFETQPSVPPALTHSDHSDDVHKVVIMSLVTSCPPPPVMSHVRNAVRNADVAVRHTALGLVTVILNKVKAILEHCSEQREGKPASRFTDFALHFQESLSRILPDMLSLSFCWSAILRTEKETNLPSVGEYVSRVLEVLCLYQRLLPSAYNDHPIDYASLLQGVQSLAVDGNTLSLLQIYVLQLLAESDASRLSFAREGKGRSSILSLMLKLIRKTAVNHQLQTTVLHLTVKLLLATGVFEDDHRSELDTWLSVMTDCLHDDEVVVTDFLESVMGNVINNPFKYADAALELMTHCGLFGEKNGLYTANQTSPPSGGSRLPFSLLSVAAVDGLINQKGGNYQVLHGYVSKVLLIILHDLVDPTPLATLISHNAAVFPDLQIVAATWIQKGQNISASWQALSSDFLGLLMKSFHLHKCGAQLRQKILTCLQQRSLERLPESVHQAVLYLKTLIFKSCEDTTPENYKKLMKLYFDVILEVLKRLEESKETGNDVKTEPNVEEADHEISLASVISSLAPNKPEPGDLQQGICDFVLGQPFMLHWFLLPDESFAKVSAAKPITKLVTHHCCQFLKFAKQSSRIKFVEKVYSVLDRIATAEFKKRYVGYEDLFAAVEMALPYFGSDLCVNVLDRLSLLVDEHENCTKVVMETMRRCALDEGFALLPRRCIESLSNFVQKSSDLGLQDKFFEILLKNPINSLSLSEDFVVWCLNEGKIDVAKVAAVHDAGTCTVLCDWLDKSLKQWMENVQLFAPLLLSVVKQEGSENGSLTEVLRKVLWNDKWLEMVGSIQSVESAVIDLMVLVIPLTKGELLSILQQLQPSKDPVAFHLYVNVTSKLQLVCSDGNQWISRADMVSHCIQTVTLCCGDKDSNLCQTALETAICTWKEATSTDKEKLPVVIPKDAWKSFVKAGLKYLYGEPLLTDLLSSLLPLLYAAGSAHSPALGQLYEMTISHSQFLALMLGDPYLPKKASLVKLLVVIKELDSSPCESGHLSVLLGSYSATLCQTDRYILRLMHLYEQNGGDLTQHKPYLWGRKAIDEHFTSKHLGRSLSALPSPSDVLDLLNPATLEKSALNFPLTRKLVPVAEPGTHHDRLGEDVYDPCFMLPLFSSLVQPASSLPCRKFIESNCLGYVVTCLSSHDEAVRGLARFILTDFHAHLEGATKFSDCDQFMYSLECVRNALDKENGKLPCIITTFLFKTFQHLLKPDQHMYMQLNSFLLLKPIMDVFNVPEFYKLFNSSYIEFKQERSWMLNLLYHGLRETADYHIYQKRFIFKLLMSFFDCHACDDFNQVQILHIINRACSIRTVAYDLVRNRGIVSWIAGTVHNRSRHTQTLSCVIKCLHTLWLSILGNELQAIHSPGLEKQKCLPVTFINQFLLTVLSMLQTPHVWNALDSYGLKLYLGILDSVLSHQIAAQSQYAANNYSVLIVNICTTHAILILRRLAVISKNHDLLSAVDPVARQRGVQLYDPVYTDNREFTKMDGYILDLTNSDGVDFPESLLQCSRLVLNVLLHWVPSKGISCFSRISGDNLLDKDVGRNSAICGKSDIAVEVLLMHWVLQQKDMGIGNIGRVINWSLKVLQHSSGICEYLMSKTSTASFIVSRLLMFYDHLYAKADGAVDGILPLIVQLNKVFFCILSAGLSNSGENMAVTNSVDPVILDDTTRMIADGEILKASAVLRKLWIK